METKAKNKTKLKTKAKAKTKMLFVGLNQNLINIITGTEKSIFDNCEFVAALVGDPNLQGRVIPYPGGLLFTAKLEEFPKFNFDMVVIAEENPEVINVLINQLVNAKVDLSKIRLFKDNQLLVINLNSYPQIAPEDRPKLLFDVSIDVSIISNLSNATGIPRVLRNIYKNIDTQTKHNIMPVQWSHQGVITCNKFDSYIYNQKFNDKEYVIKFIPEDKILLMDSIWCTNPQYYSYLAAETEKNNISTYAVIYDLVPIRNSSYPLCVKILYLCNLYF